MTSGAVWKVILRFAFPLLIGNLLQQLYNVTDSVIVGQFLGKESLAAVSASFFIYYFIISLVIGCIFGSFLNVVIWRVPNHISLVNPKRSFCPNCEAPIAWYDNIPIISWLVLGAKCRHCKEPIAVRYPIVEALGGLSFLAVTLGALFGAYSPWI